MISDDTLKIYGFTNEGPGIWKSKPNALEVIVYYFSTGDVVCMDQEDNNVVPLPRIVRPDQLQALLIVFGLYPTTQEQT